MSATDKRLQEDTPEKMTYYEQLVQGVRNAFLQGKTREIKFRKEQLKALKQLYEQEEAAICAALATDLNKPKQESILLEINVLKSDIDYILNNIDDWVKPEKVPANLVTIFDKSVIFHDPYGVVLVLGAWNYPMMLPLMPVTGAIAAGNCVIIKPSEMSPATAKVIADLVPKYLDPECFKVVCGGISETTELLKQKFDYIFYTGSPHVGRIVRDAANKYLTPTTLELGGKSPLYIDDSVDMDMAARRILWGKFINLGQTCIAPDYVLCTRSVQDKLIDIAKEVLKEWYGSQPNKSPDLCRIVSDKHANRIAEYLNCGTPAIGGQVNLEDRFIEPTVLVDVPADSKVMTEEIFGPVLPIVNIQSAFEAIKFINEREKPLTFYVFTTNTSVQNLLLQNTTSGSMCVNDTMVHMSVHGLPFGGVGQSGMGAYHGKASYDTFTHRKSCLVRNYNKIADYIGSYRYPPYSESKTTFLSNMLREYWMPSLKFLPYVITFGLGIASVFAAKEIAKAVGQDDD
ncbi:aldehyde dehydrogenase type III [Oratosquilla oratoria]|uniref:aldehyde dehydrogenase type III n=1 Tax=Oratosquilla oratoria TaxID=337810 RepID=UPI003F76B387